MSPARVKLANKKREQILKGALRAFFQNGYAGTSMDGVAREAGVSKPTIYNHFKDKEGLFTSLLEHVVVDRFLADSPESAPSTEPHTHLTRVANDFLRRCDDWEYLSLFRLVVAESARFPELAEWFIKRVISPNSNQLSEYLNLQKTFPNPLITARVFLGSLSSFVLTQEILGAKHMMPVTQEEFVRHLVDMTMASSRKPRKSRGS